MIKKNNKTVGFIYKNNQNIDKVYKGTDLVFEQGYTREQTGVPPITTTYQAIGKNLKDYKIYGNSIQGKLPDTYQQVEYIESTGTQYIDTGITPDTTLEFDTTFNTSNNFSQETIRYGCIFGSRISSAKADVQLTTYSEFGYKGTIRCGNNYGDNAWLSNNVKINAKLKNNMYYVDNTEIRSTTIEASNDYNIYIFALNQSGTAIQHGKLKLHTFKLWKNDVLVRDFIPCYRKSDNEIGMYDLVTNTFFTNAGTGVFLKGSNAPTPSAPIEIESVGDLITDTNDVNNGKYKIPVIVGNTTTNIYLDEPLRKIGDYSDYIDFKNSKVVRNIAKKVLNGTEDWGMPGTIISDYSSYRIVNFIPNLPLQTPIEELLCTHFEAFPKSQYQQEPIQNKVTSYGNTNQIVVLVSNNIADSNNQTTTANWINWLSNNNVTLYYSKQPTEETITLPNIPTIKGTTIFEIDTEIQPSSMYIKYKGK